MRIKELKIENYKSLRNITFCPGEMTVIVGANGSGKSNLASAFEFIADVYRNGLDYAVLNKGGFDNIAFRRQRRTRSAVKFSLDYVHNELMLPFDPIAQRKNRPLYRIKHSFSIAAGSRSIRSDYLLVDEVLEIFVSKQRQSESDYESFPPFMRLAQSGGGEPEIEVHAEKKIDADIRQYLEFISRRRSNSAAGSLTLMARELFFFGHGGIGDISVHQFSPQISRTPGAPSPLPRLTSYGQNLAALVDWLQRNHPKRWADVEDSMRQIIPGLGSIGVGFSTNNLLVLNFNEEGAGRPWTSQDVSDGTIQTLALLCCLADPRNALLFLEEPENSVHPWIVKQIIQQIKKNSKKTQTILTTHSPIILNVVEPKDIWICHKKDGVTMLSHLPELTPDVVKDWEAGDGRLFDLFDMGLVREAMPKGQII